MALDTIVTLSVIGGILLVNSICLLLAWVTPYGKSWIYHMMKDESKAFFIFWNFFMLLTGICFWVCVGFEAIRYGIEDCSDFKDISPKEVYHMLEEAWAKNETK